MSTSAVHVEICRCDRRDALSPRMCLGLATITSVFRRVVGVCRALNQRQDVPRIIRRTLNLSTEIRDVTRRMIYVYARGRFHRRMRPLMDPFAKPPTPFFLLDDNQHFIRPRHREKRHSTDLSRDLLLLTGRRLSTSHFPRAAFINAH